MFRGIGNGDLRAFGCSTDMAGRFFDFADSAVLQQSDGFDELPAASLLSTDLNDATCLLADIANRSAFGHCKRHGLFAVNIFASEHCLDEQFGMPVVGGGDMDDIDFGIIEDGSIILWGGGLVSGPFFHECSGQFGSAAIGIKDADIVSVFFEVRGRAVGALKSGSLLAPTASGSYGSHSGPIVGLKKTFGSGCPVHDCRGGKCRTGRAKEASSVQCFVHNQLS